MKEQLDITLFMLVNYWKKMPEFSVYVDDQEIIIDQSDMESGKLVEKSFKTAFLEKGQHQIVIELKNKNKDDIVRELDGTIVRETNMVLFSIAVNNFRTPLKDLLARNSSFITPDGVRHSLKKLPLTIKHNGKFVFDFESPFSFWAIREL